METSLKKRYPFRLGTTSFIYPADYVTNVDQLAPYWDEIELLLFESKHLPAQDEIERLCSLAHEHGITYNVHLPMDVELAADHSTIRRQSIDDTARAIDRVSALEPTTHTLHVTYNHTNLEEGVVENWQHLAIDSIERILNVSGIDSQDISLETLDFQPLWLLPVVESLDLSVCVDIGHVILYGFDLPRVLEVFANRTTILHLHGVSGGRDHLSLIHLDPDSSSAISRYLQSFSESVSLEVFNLKRLNESMTRFADLINCQP